jgi:hypothetical protein
MRSAFVGVIVPVIKAGKAISLAIEWAAASI